MKETLLDRLVCPACEGILSLSDEDQRGDEVLGGVLSCVCGEVYPIIGGVPRMLGAGLRDDIIGRYPDFFERHGSLTGWEAASLRDGRGEPGRATMDRFGYEWKEFSDYDCENFSEFARPLGEKFFQGKLGLDVGCGAGRHAAEAHRRGAEVIGVDLSPAVDAAHQRHAGNERVHIVQADIFSLPFRRQSFDFAYSLGVLQHTVDPGGAFLTLTRYVGCGGALFVWVYAHAPRKVALELLRLVSQRLSNEGIRRMAFLCNLVDYGLFVNTYRLACRLPAVGGLARRCMPPRIREYAGHGYRVSYADWFDRLSAPITHYYKEQQVREWLERSGLCRTTLSKVGDSWWWLYGEKGTNG